MVESLLSIGIPNLWGSDPGAAYAAKLVNVYGATVDYRLTDIQAGTTILACFPTFNGTLVGWTLQNGTSPVPGESLQSPLLDGTNDYGNLDVAALVSAFNGKIGGIFVWGRVSAAGVWTDSTDRRLINLVVDANNRIQLYKNASNNTITWDYRAGGTAKTVNKTSFSPTTWFSMALTYQDAVSGDSVQPYANGSPEGAAQTSNGTFAGALDTAWLGAYNGTPLSVWDGWIAYVALRFGSIWSAAQIAAMHAAVS